MLRAKCGCERLSSNRIRNTSSILRMDNRSLATELPTVATSMPSPPSHWLSVKRLRSAQINVLQCCMHFLQNIFYMQADNLK